MSNDRESVHANWKALWIEALLSGRYKQGAGQLRSREGYCCLGVLCDVLYPGSIDERGRASLESGFSLLPAPVQRITGLSRASQLDLSYMNDGCNIYWGAAKNFMQIADWIAANVEPIERGIGFAIFRAATLTALQRSEP